MKKNIILPIISDHDGLERYIRFANNIPILSLHEEQKLALLLKYQNDIKAAQKMIMSHLRFVIKVARGFSGYGLPMTDLIQEGNIGLMKAVKRFNPNIGVRLVSFAVHWVKAEMHEYILKNWRIVKIATTKAQRKLFFNLRSSKKRLGWFKDNEVKAIAKDLGVKSETVLEMEKRMNAYDMSFDYSSHEDNKYEKNFNNEIYLEDKYSNPENKIAEEEFEKKLKIKLKYAINSLDNRSKDIIISRWLFVSHKLTLHDIAKKHNISAERVRQIEEAAIKKMKIHVSKIS